MPIFLYFIFFRKQNQKLPKSKCRVFYCRIGRICPTFQNIPIFPRKFDALGKMSEKISAETIRIIFPIFIQSLLIVRVILNAITIFSRAREICAAKISGGKQIGNMPLTHIFFVFCNEIRLNNCSYLINYHFIFRCCRNLTNHNRRLHIAVHEKNFPVFIQHDGSLFAE